MTSKVIVFVADRGDQRFGELSVFDSSGEAERLVETLLEAGCDRRRIRVFSGAEMEARVSQRPVVALVHGDQEEAGEESVAPEALADQKEAASGEDGESEAEPARRWNGSPWKKPARPVEMMPELLH